MIILGDLSYLPTVLVFDIDDTLYIQPEPYKEQIRQSNYTLLSHKKDVSFEEARLILDKQRREIRKKLNREVTITETLYSLGFSRDELQSAREKMWLPEHFIDQDHELAQIFHLLQRHYKIVFGTNSPLNVGIRILKKLGIYSALEETLVFAPESFLIQKPASGFFREVARAVKVDPGRCLTIGDRQMSEGTPAIEAGYCGAIIIENRNELIKVLNKALLDNLTALDS